MFNERFKWIASRFLVLLVILGALFLLKPEWLGLGEQDKLGLIEAGQQWLAQVAEQPEQAFAATTSSFREQCDWVCFSGLITRHRLKMLDRQALTVFWHNPPKLILKAPLPTGGYLQIQGRLQAKKLQVDTLLLETAQQ